MALGAVLLSLPVALGCAFYGYAFQGLEVFHGLLIYMIAGCASLMTFTLVQGLRAEDIR